MFRAQLSAGINLDMVAVILGFGKRQVGSGYGRKQHRKGGGTRCSPCLMGARGHLSEISEKYKDGLLWLRHGSALLDSAETRWKQIQKEIKPLRADWWLQG